MSEMNNTQATRAEFMVEGMSCNHCRQMIENSLKKTTGVSDAQADPGTGLVQVVFDPATVSLSQLENIVELAGYPVVKK